MQGAGMKLVQGFLHHTYKFDVPATADEEDMVLLFLAGSGSRREQGLSSVVPSAKPTYMAVRYCKIAPPATQQSLALMLLLTQHNKTTKCLVAYSTENRCI